LSFPAFPSPTNQDGSRIPVLKDNAVTLPFWYWQKLVDYALDVEKVCKQYQDWQRVYYSPTVEAGKRDVSRMKKLTDKGIRKDNKVNGMGKLAHKTAQKVDRE
jgi:hypothetical protein